ncbi:hypothetical protein SLE2022_213460 [Rubroshorea leprosula]
MFLRILLFTVLYVITAHFLHKIRQLPPYPFPILPIIEHLNLLNKPLHRCLSKISNRYGPIFFLHLGSRRVLVVSSPAAAEDCLSKNDIVFAYRPRILAGKHLGYNYTSLLWAPDEVHLLLRKLFKNQGQTIEMKPMFFEVTMNVMMRIIAGKRYYGDSMVEVEEAMRFKKMVVESFRTGDATNVGDFLPAFRWISNNEKKLIELQKEKDKFVQELVEHHKDEDIKSMILVLLLAGTETSAGTMEWAVSLLLNNSEVLKKAQAEIDDVVGKNRLVEESDLSRLPYLHCVINETLKMLTFASLIQCFECERVGEEMVDMAEGTGLTMTRAHPLQARCRPRQAMVELLSQT